MALNKPRSLFQAGCEEQYSDGRAMFIKCIYSFNKYFMGTCHIQKIRLGINDRVDSSAARSPCGDNGQDAAFRVRYYTSSHTTQ